MGSGQPGDSPVGWVIGSGERREMPVRGVVIPSFRQPGDPGGTHGFAPHPRGWLALVEDETTKTEYARAWI